MNLKEYKKSLRAAAALMDPEAAAADAAEQDSALRKYLDRSQKEIWLVSVANETIGGVAGRVVSAHPMTAARLIKESSHVFASPEQVKEYKAELAKRREAILQEIRDQKGPVPQIVISQEVLAAVSKQQSRPGADKGA